MTRRLYYIDWLRVLAVLLLFPFHTSRVFNFGEPFYIKSGYLSVLINIPMGFIDRWHMPLLFLLAGASTYLSLAKRTPGRYAGERLTRLGVPLLFGILVIIPPQTWIGAQYNSGYTGSFWQYLTSGAFLRWNIQEAGDYYGGFGIGQLWFILFLLAFSLLALPLFAWGRGRGTARVQSWARRLARPAWWLLPPVVLFFADAVPEIGGKAFVYYLVYFVFGFIVIADDTFTETAERLRWLALGIGTVLCFAYILTGWWRDAQPDPSAQRAVADYLGMLGSWAMLIGLVGVGRRYLERTSKTLAYLAEGSYPIYILHQTMIVLAAFWIVRLPIGGVAQWIAVLVVAVVASFAIYELVRRVGVLRFLFGMRPRRPHAGAPPTAATPARSA